MNNLSGRQDVTYYVTLMHGGKGTIMAKPMNYSDFIIFKEGIQQSMNLVPALLSKSTMAGQYCGLRICLLSEYAPVLSSVIPQTPNHAGVGGFFHGRVRGMILHKHREVRTEGFCIMTSVTEILNTVLAPFKSEKPHRS